MIRYSYYYNWAPRTYFISLTFLIWCGRKFNKTKTEPYQKPQSYNSLRKEIKKYLNFFSFYDIAQKTRWFFITILKMPNRHYIHKLSKKITAHMLFLYKELFVLFIKNISTIFIYAHWLGCVYFKSQSICITLEIYDCRAYIYQTITQNVNK